MDGGRGPSPRAFRRTTTGRTDFNGDGKADILWHHQVTGELYAWFLDGTVTTAGAYLTPTRFADTSWQIRGVADFDGDGKVDMLWHHQETGDLYVWFLNGTVIDARRVPRRRGASPTRAGRSAGWPTSTATASRTSCGTTRRRATCTCGSWTGRWR